MASRNEWQLQLRYTKLHDSRVRSRVGFAIALVLLGGILAISGCSDATSDASAANPSPRPTSYEQYNELFADWAPRYVECARKYGADARLLDNGSISGAYAQGRPVADGLDAACVKEVGLPPNVPKLTDSFLAGMYELFVKEAQCLRDHGYVISLPPSRREWVENYGGDSWDPLMDVNNAGRDVEEADGLCPQPDPREAEQLGSTLQGG